ncbi:hypothetical protein LTR64_002971 [Lithohypha guttulata]|uniref:uncharacterized protein n=1 Tax=Lithohypha guttulata TaxID=1690604 RepID=UPI002DDE9BF8|nr:hypothetical protein LTR51_000805 [Lithohypha guttulata]
MWLKNLLPLLLWSSPLLQPAISNPVILGQRASVTTESQGLQDIVTWDEYSFLVRGERIVFFFGEFHPFRLPSPDLWLDVLQKVKALGYNGVSFYVNWALLEGEPGVFRADGVFALEPFFEAASEAGIYLLARPGSYINAEVAGGGFPGWLSHVDGTFRTNATGFLEATDLYMKRVGELIAKAQITEGGPVILVQPENEYTNPAGNITFPNSDYFQYVIDQIRAAGIVVPTISNDASPKGIFSPDSAIVTTHVDVYGHDSYPLGFNCEQPYNWTDNRLPTNFWTLHEQQSPSTPYSIIEFQGGSFDPWGGYGFDNCATLTNEQFERIFYKNDISFRVTMLNLYMTYGGTNWGNLGHPLGYTSYDYGAPISEDRAVLRAKYSEAKLIANFLKVTPAYVTSIPMNYTNGSFASTSDIAVTPLIGNGTDADIYVVRHAAYNSMTSTPYALSVPSSAGNITIPQLKTLSDHLTLNGRDSKIHVVDCSLGNKKLLYSSAEVFTWQQYSKETVLVLYGGENETHEFAVTASQCKLRSGHPSAVTIATQDQYDVVQWQVTPDAGVVQCGDLTIHLLWRNDAYNWWVLELPASAPVSNYSLPTKTNVIINGGYLMRTARLEGGNLYLTGDINTTTTISVAGSPSFNKIYFNGKDVGTSPATLVYIKPQLNIPILSKATWSKLTWASMNSLPEIESTYSDELWTIANKTSTVNQFRPTTPQVLYASDYGYHSGSLLYRGHFSTPAGSTSLNLSLLTQGGYAYGYSVWLNSTNILQYPGISTSQNHNVTIPLSSLTPSTNYIVTIFIDHLGLTENFNPGNDTMREPRGLLSYNLTTSTTASIPIIWKLTGNLNGEHYIDKTRGPLNEGGMFFERQGYHLPSAPLTNTSVFPSQNDSPLAGFSGPGLRFYATTFPLDLQTPEYDIPLAFVFTNSSTTTSNGSRPTAFRAQLYINGFQFGKYVNHIGPQTVFPVPEGVLNYHGLNYVGVSLWNLEDDDSGVRVKLDGFELRTSSAPVMSGRGREVRLSYVLPRDGWSRRQGAY